MPGPTKCQDCSRPWGHSWEPKQNSGLGGKGTDNKPISDVSGGAKCYEEK